MAKITTLNINYSFKKKGTVTCKVTSGNVTVQLNGNDAGKFSAEGQGKGNKFSKTKNDNNDSQWNVIVTKVDDKAAVVFLAPND